MEGDKRALKSLSEDRVGGYLIVFGNTNERDLHDEYFTPDTDIKESWYPVRPVLYQHGHDKRVKSNTVGKIEKLEKKEDGWWVEAQIDLHKDYARDVLKLVKEGALYWSSGAMSHLVDVLNGEIKTWPVIEGSLTPTPAEPRRTNVSQIKSHFDEIGVNLREEENDYLASIESTSTDKDDDAVEVNSESVITDNQGTSTTIIINNNPSHIKESQKAMESEHTKETKELDSCLLYTSPSPRD